MLHARPLLLIALAAILGIAVLVALLEREPRTPVPVLTSPLERSSAAEREDPLSPALPGAALEEASERVFVTTGASAGGAANDGAKERPATIRVIVTDLTQKPLAGSRVRALQGSRATGCETAADGSCEFQADWGNHVILVIVVEREGHEHRRLEVLKKNEVRVTLAPVTTLTGRVLDKSTGLPIPGALIERPHQSCRGCEPDRVRADAEGRYELPAVPWSGSRANAVGLLVKAPGYPPARSYFVIRDPTVAKHDLELERGTPISGAVVDFTTGAPVADAVIQWGKDQLDFTTGAPAGAVFFEWGKDQLQTDELGRFAGPVLPDRPADTVHLSIRAEGYCRVEGDFLLHQLADPLRVQLPACTAVTGVVRDPGGQPIPGAGLRTDWVLDSAGSLSTLSELLDGWKFVFERPSASSDGEGRFRIDGLVPWSRGLQILATHAGHADARVPVPALGGPEETMVEIVLEPAVSGATIRGVASLNGRPMNGGVYWQGPSRQGSGRVRAGKYVLKNVEPGTVTLSVRPRYLPANALPSEARVVVAVELGADQEQDFDLRIPLTAVSGHVRFSDGRPVEGIEVCAYHVLAESRYRYDGESAADGGYALELPSLGGSLLVSVSSGGETFSVDGVLPGATDVDFVLPCLGQLLYRAIDRETGKPLPEIGLSWKRAGSGPYQDNWNRGSIDTEGYFAMHVPAGPVDLCAWVNPGANLLGHRPAYKEGVLLAAAPGSTRVEFELERGFSLRLRLDPSCGPLTDDHSLFLLPAEIWQDVLETEDGWDFGPRLPGGFVYSLSPSFDRSGQATLRGLAPGLHRFKVFPDDVMIEPAEIELTSEPSEPIVITWRRK